MKTLEEIQGLKGRVGLIPATATRVNVYLDGNIYGFTTYEIYKQLIA